MYTKTFYQDDNIVICYKPSGVLSQESDRGENSLVNSLGRELCSDIFPVHRLDKETSGIMIYAKNKHCASLLSKLFADHSIYKEYRALVHGDVFPQKGEMKDLLFRDRQKNKSYVVKRERKGVKTAILEYEVLERLEINNKPFSLVKIILHTGRTHQIRVQFSYRGYSLAGDRRYGARDEFENLQLTASRLKLKHPITGEVLDYSI